MGSNCSCQGQSIFLKEKNIEIEQKLINLDIDPIQDLLKNKQPFFQQITLIGDNSINQDLQRLEEELEFIKEFSAFNKAEKDPSSKKVTETSKSVIEDKQKIPQNPFQKKKNSRKSMCDDIEYLLRGEIQSRKPRYSDVGCLVIKRNQKSILIQDRRLHQIYSPLTNNDRMYSPLQSQKSPKSLRKHPTPRGILKNVSQDRPRDFTNYSIISSGKRVSFDNSSVKDYNRKSKIGKKKKL